MFAIFILFLNVLGPQNCDSLCEKRDHVSCWALPITIIFHCPPQQVSACPNLMQDHKTSRQFPYPQTTIKSSQSRLLHKTSWLISESLFYIHHIAQVTVLVSYSGTYWLHSPIYRWLDTRNTTAFNTTDHVVIPRDAIMDRLLEAI